MAFPNNTFTGAGVAAAGRNLFQKPPTVEFTFIQRKDKFHKSGTVVDQASQVVYRLIEREDGGSSLGGLMMSTTEKVEKKPLNIVRAVDGSLVETLEWGEKVKRARAKGLAGMGVVGLRDLVDDSFAFCTPDGSRFQWEGPIDNSWKLLDHRVPQPYSLNPATSAILRPRKPSSAYGNSSGAFLQKQPQNTILEVLPGALASLPGLLDWCVITALYLEYVLSEAQRKEVEGAFTETLVNSVLGV